MKNRSFLQRLRFASQGIAVAWRLERSFRTQVLVAVAAAVVLVVLRPPAVWVLLCAMCAAAVLSAELFNTALEHALDRLAPEQHPSIAMAKDCAAAAVLVFSVVSVAVGATTIWVALSR